MTQSQGYRAPRRLYLSRDKSRVVEEGDPEAGFLLAGTGVVVPEADVARYKLRELPDPAAEAPEVEDAPSGAQPEQKMVAGPPENKAQKAPPAEAAPEKPASRRTARGGVPPRTDGA